MIHEREHKEDKKMIEKGHSWDPNSIAQLCP